MAYEWRYNSHFWRFTTPNIDMNISWGQSDLVWLIGVKIFTENNIKRQ